MRSRPRPGFKKGSTLWLAAIMALGVVSLTALPALATDRYVDPTGSNTSDCSDPNNPCKTITYALTRAEEEGDTIHVASGTYDTALGEIFPIVVDKEVKISCPSQDPRAIIAVPASHAGIVIVPNGDGSSIENCEITSASLTDRGDIGIVVIGADPVTLIGNDIHDLIEGIRLISTNGNSIANNVIHENIGIGIHLEESDGNTFTDNDIWGNGEGLFLNESHGNNFTQDQYRDSAFTGIHLEKSGQEAKPNTFDNVTVTGNGGWGFYLIDSHWNVIQRSEISGNKGGGIKLEGSSDNVIGCVSGTNCGNFIRDNGDGLDEDINVLLTKGMMVEFTADIQTPGFTLKGSNLIGKADGYEIDDTQINELKEELAGRLNIAVDDIEVNIEKLEGSQRNTIASNVITSNVNNDEGRNIGIKLEPGSFDNLIVNNLITNEALNGSPRSGLPPGKLDRGIVLLSSSNKILFNAIEFLDVGIVRGGENRREDVKHLHLFAKLAEVQTSPRKLIIVTEVEDEPLPEPVYVSSTVRFNRLALNFIEKNGIGIDVFDAESNLIDENLFLDNQNGGIVLSRMESQGFWGIIDIRIERNDFKGGYSIVNLSTLPLDVSDNYQTQSEKVGKLKGPSRTSPFCESNFDEDKFRELGSELDLDFLVGFFGDSNDTNGDGFDDVLPPNTEFLPAGVVLPPEKPRDCNPDVFPPQQGPNPDIDLKVPQLAGAQGPPRDLDRDGLYEDVNGNGRLDFDDAVTLARNLDSGVVQTYKAAFDFNGNGRVDFDDAIRLALRIGGAAAAQALREMFGRLELEVTGVTARFISGGGSDINPAEIAFLVEGRGIANIRVEVFNLGGRRVYDSGFVPGSELSWHLEGETGEPLANGVYLYIVTVRGHSGELLRTRVQKLVVLRGR